MIDTEYLTSRVMLELDIEDMIWGIRTNPGLYPELDFLAPMPTTTAKEWVREAVSDYDEVIRFGNPTVLMMCLLIKYYRKVKKKYIRAHLPLDEHFYEDVITSLVEVHPEYKQEVV